uniref:Uncharacterized protein n=1 Tax=Anguilla anguilla TaxID=7936 RepID=A0A0E9QI24_ANGAN
MNVEHADWSLQNIKWPGHRRAVFREVSAGP